MFGLFTHLSLQRPSLRLSPPEGREVRGSDFIVAAHPRFDRRPPARTAVHSSGPDDCGTLEFSPYRCFLPDLTGFGDPSCAGPDLQHR